MAVGLFADDPPCSGQTCPEMRASEWQYLCAAHEPPKSCCAIDYCCHTLDWSATQLTSSKLFPSRLALGTESATSTQQVRKMTEIFRRVYRIFAHAWFQHREVFWRVENKTGLYVFFKTVCDEYRLIPEDNYTIPPEAEGIEATTIADQSDQASVLKREIVGPSSAAGDLDLAGNATVATGNTTKRHRHGMGERNSSISTIIHEEVDEDEDMPEDERIERGQIRVLDDTAQRLERTETMHHEDMPMGPEHTVEDSHEAIPLFPTHGDEQSKLDPAEDHANSSGHAVEPTAAQEDAPAETEPVLLAFDEPGDGAQDVADQTVAS